MTLGELLTRVLARMLASGDNQPQLARGIISHRLARARVHAAAHEATWRKQHGASEHAGHRGGEVERLRKHAGALTLGRARHGGLLSGLAPGLARLQGAACLATVARTDLAGLGLGPGLGLGSGSG